MKDNNKTSFAWKLSELLVGVVVIVVVCAISVEKTPI